MPNADEVERWLRKLQGLVRRPASDGGQAVLTKALPRDMTANKHQVVGLLPDEVEAMRQAAEALRNDVAYEHLRDPDEAVWRFVAECCLDGDNDHLADFVARHRRDVEDRVCYIPVEHLSVEVPLSLHGITLLPMWHGDVPVVELPWFNLEPPVGCVAAVPVRGTSSPKMATRARGIAEHELRVLRIALREDMGINDRQLRFRLGTTYAFSGDQAGFAQRDDVAYELPLTEGELRLAEGQPVFGLGAVARTDIERKALLAVRWMERAWLSGEPLVALLYLFFALEALLGDKSEKLKAHDLALRQMMLGHVVAGHFSHPNETWFLYDQVRSGAVHGEGGPEVSDRDVSSFAWSVRKTLAQYLTLASEQGFGRRGRLLRFLNEHADRAQAVEWLRSNGGPVWTDYLDGLHEQTEGAPPSGEPGSSGE